MTPTSLAYLILGALCLVWPLATLLFRRFILGAQWLLLCSMLMLGITFILYGCLFNTFLRGEYLLLVLYMAFALFTPPTAILATAVLTRPDGTTRISHAAVLPPLITALLMLVSFFIGGADMYRLWVTRGTFAEADLFFDHSWRYNLIVSIHYYLFHAVLLLEIIFVALYAIVHLRRYRRILAEYFTADRHGTTSFHLIYTHILIVSLLLIVSIVLFPLNMPRPLLYTVIVTAVLALSMFVLGIYLFRVSYGAETLSENLHQPYHRTRRDMLQLGREISSYVEQTAYFNPDLSVFQLASHFHVSQDQVVDSIHLLHGTSFADYLDSLRVEHAATLFANVANTDDPENIERVAHQCGYLTAEALERAFEKIMHTPIDKSGLL